MDKPHTTPKDFFLSIGAIIALYVSAGSLLALLFGIINATFPDALNSYYNFYTGGMRFAIASLIIVFPIFVGLSVLIRKDIVANPAKRDLSIRKWLVYLTLFVTGLVVVGDFIAVLNVFLSGELTTRFIAKVIAILVVSGAVFGYYLYDIKRSATDNKGASRAIIASAFVLVLGSLVWGFSVMGSPATARNIRFDATRQSDLQSIQWQIINVWQQKGAIPTELSELNDSISYFSVPTDPETRESYVYEKTGAKTFKLCATFARSTADGDAQTSTVVREYGMNDVNWKHSAGLHCFDRSIDADLYPVVQAAKRF
jgi:hypothetical protein